MMKTTGETHLISKVVKFALFSRIALIILQVFFNYFIPDHDACVFNPPLEDANKSADNTVHFLFNGFRRWDAVYFIHIAEHGYIYENTLAFFPLYPLCMRVLANSIFYPLQNMMAFHNVLLLSGVIFNVLMFVKSAKVVFFLGKRVLQNEYLAYKAALIYCINPGSIFMTAAYSEALFAYITLSGMLVLEQGNLMIASLVFGISCLARSNGLTTIAYVLYKVFNDLIKNMISFYLSKVKDKYVYISTFAVAIAKGGQYILIFIIPYVIFQYFVYNAYCTNPVQANDITGKVLNYGLLQGYRFPWEAPPEWCFYYIPVSYGYIQSRYWDVGFLKYYEFKQIPNFLLATPMILICSKLIWNYFKRRPRFFTSLGILNDKSDQEKSNAYGFYSKLCYPYIFHLMALLIFGVLNMHVQVITRLLCSSCPVIYWYVAMVTSNKEDIKTMTNSDNQKDENTISTIESDKNVQRNVENLLTDQLLSWKSNDRLSQIIFLYFLGYYVIGTITHVNFLPWT